jgi:hypothetical protein
MKNAVRAMLDAMAGYEKIQTACENEIAKRRREIWTAARRALRNET